MVGEIYAALIAANVPEAKATAAAAAIASYDAELRDMRHEWQLLRYDMQHALHEARVFRATLLTLIGALGGGLLWRLW